MQKLIARKLTRVALAATLLLGACATEEEPEESSEETDTTTTTEAAAGATVTITGQDYAYEGVPAAGIAAGSKIAFKNASTKEVHEIVAFKLPETEARPAADLVKLPEAELEQALGGPPATVVVALPGKDGIAVEGDGTLAGTGRYIFLCFIPTGASVAEYEKAIANPEAGEPNITGGPPHFTQGMFAETTAK